MSAATLGRALARWEAESGSYRRLCGVPYRLEPFLAGYLLGALGENLPEVSGDIQASFRVGFRSGTESRTIEMREGKS